MDDFFDFDRAAGGDVPYPAHRSLDSTQGHGGPRTRNSRGPDLYRFTNPAAPRLVEQSSCDTASVEPCSMEKGGHSKPAYDRARMAGSRFSMEVVKILRCWFSAHDHYPYPSDRQTKALEAQTGLTKGQITTWLANARRKKKCKTPRVHNAINLPDTPRPPTPLPRSMNPLERWQHSPPDDEPAAASAIFDAINRSAPSSECGEGSNNLRPRSSSGSRCHAPSTSATETSVQSSESCSSVCSSASGESSGSFSSLKINKYRRRSRRPQRQSSASLNASTRPRTFQCTFCTDSFKTKYDWQRHEKSLHLSLEMWTCAAGGPTALSPDINLPLCVYCGAPEPDPPHLEAHNHSSCAAHSVESRTFYRKDHFRQHLKLVHCARFQSWSMSVWKTEMLSVRARCGFCGLWVDTWTARAAHLADHFKNGKTMADWKGDWGFEPEILALLENEMPPCKSLIPRPA
jgi:hypothetical protein